MRYGCSAVIKTWFCECHQLPLLSMWMEGIQHLADNRNTCTFWRPWKVCHWLQLEQDCRQDCISAASSIKTSPKIYWDSDSKCQGELLAVQHQPRWIKSKMGAGGKSEVKGTKRRRKAVFTAVVEAAVESCSSPPQSGAAGGLCLQTHALWTASVWRASWKNEND